MACTAFACFEAGHRGFESDTRHGCYIDLPVTLAERSKACTAFARSEAGDRGLESHTRHKCLVCVCDHPVFILYCV
jgi:hypothetical protein